VQECEGAEKERDNDKHMTAESLHFLACPTFGRVTCERLHFLVQDHRNSFDSRSQSSRKGALHGVTSELGSDVPLVVRLGNSNKEAHLSQTDLNPVLQPVLHEKENGTSHALPQKNTKFRKDLPHGGPSTYDVTHVPLPCLQNEHETHETSLNTDGLLL